MNNRICLLLLGLCLVAQEARWCHCGRAEYDSDDDDSDSDSATRREQERKQLDALLENDVECTVSVFSEYRRLTATGVGGHDGQRQERIKNKERQMLSKCKDIFAQDFAQRIASLGEADAAKLSSLASFMKQENHPTLPHQLGWLNWGNGLTTLGMLAFMGKEGAFVDYKKLKLSAFEGKYSQLVEGLCQRIRNKLEPTAEIFRMYSNMQESVLKGVDRSNFELAAASELCGQILARDRYARRSDFDAYEDLFFAQQLPGDSRWETQKSDIQERIAALLATGSGELGPDNEQCNAQFFSKLDSLVRESENYIGEADRESLMVKEGKLFGECRQVFEAELRKSIATLDPDEARNAIALAAAIYRDQPVRYYSDDGKKIGRGTLEFMQQREPSLKARKLTRAEFEEKYRQLVGALIDSVNGKLEPAVEIFRRYLYDPFVPGEGVDKDLLRWAHRSNLFAKMERHVYDVLRAYEESRSKRCKFSRFICGIA